MDDRKIIVTRQQLLTARALAGDFGHHWAECVTDELIDSLHGESTIAAGAAILDAMHEHRPDWPGLSPCWDADGDIVHTTMTGRLSWCVDAEGRAAVSVHRKGWEGPVLWARVAGGRIVDVLVSRDGAELRHFVAMREAMMALGLHLEWCEIEHEDIGAAVDRGLKVMKSFVDRPWSEWAEACFVLQFLPPERREIEMLRIYQTFLKGWAELAGTYPPFTNFFAAVIDDCKAIGSLRMPS